MYNEKVKTNNKDVERKAEAKKAINYCARQLTNKYCSIPYSNCTTLGHGEMKSLARGFLNTIGMYDDVLTESLPSLHYSYTMNNCSVDGFENIVKGNMNNVVGDYEMLPKNQLVIIVQKYCALVGLSNFIAPGRRVVDFWNIIKHNPSTLGEIDLDTLGKIVEYSGDFGNFVMDDIRLIVIDFLEDVTNRVNTKQYELISQFADKGYDIYLHNGEDLVVNKETNGTEVRYYMSELTYISLSEDDFKALGGKRRVYKLK